jgi:hypothetical protein
MVALPRIVRLLLETSSGEVCLLHTVLSSDGDRSTYHTYIMTSLPPFPFASSAPFSLG